MDHIYKSQEQELHDQLRSDHEWDQYDSCHYGWEKTNKIKLRTAYNFEIAKELAFTSIPHKTRHFRKS